MHFELWRERLKCGVRLRLCWLKCLFQITQNYAAARSDQGRRPFCKAAKTIIARLRQLLDYLQPAISSPITWADNIYTQPGPYLCHRNSPFGFRSGRIGRWEYGLEKTPNVEQPT
ncbi:hypothetical protein ACMFMG_000884 [Clarireedia jacksonii]